MKALTTPPAYLFDEVPALVWMAGSDSSCTYFNKSWLQFRGKRLEEELGEGWVEGIHTDDREECLRAYRKAFDARETFELEYRLLHHSGEYRWILDRGRPLFDDHGVFTGYIGICFDVSERKQSEESIRRSENRFKELADLLPQTVFEMDRIGTITFANRESFSMFGFTPDDFKKGLNAVQMLVPEERQRAVAEINKILEGALSPGAEYTGLRSDGTTFPIIIYSHPVIHDNEIVGLRGIIVDISHRKSIEEKLRLQTTALQTAANAIVMTNRAGEVLWANDAFTKLTGYDMSDVLGKKTNMLRSGKHGKEYYQNLWETILSGRIWRDEVVNRRKDGTFYTEDMTITPVRNEAGDITHFIAIKQDITEQKKLREQLFQAQKLESLGTLAGGIAHDFNNLLGIILVYANLLEESRDDDKIFSEGLQAITKSVARGKDITGQVLAFAHKSELKFEQVDLTELVQDFIRMARNTFPKTISFIYDGSRSAPVEADRTKLHQMLLNLCLNAKDAMNETGIITIRSGTVAGEALRRKMIDARNETYAFFSVSDAGEGMSEYTMKRIWEPFFTTKRKGKGTGLGLSVVYGIVQQHHGFADVESAVGHGTTFHIYFPLIDTGQEGKKYGGNTGIKPPGGNEGSECILFVEDEELLTSRMKPYLERRGYTVLTAQDGEEALRIYSQRRNDVDIVVTDLGLPKLSGIELYKVLRQLNPAVKIVLASGFFDPQFIAELTGHDTNALIHKPYVPSKLMALIRSVLDHETPAI